KEETEAAQAAAKASKRPYVHRGSLRDAAIEENVRRYREKPTALRFKIALGRTVTVDDLIVGRCEQASDLLGDPVILRANGTALYNFASVVDDAALKITHVVRAREHLSNTYPQVLFLEAMGLPLPRYAHVPVVNWKGKKMSKRDLPPPTEEDRSR